MQGPASSAMGKKGKKSRRAAANGAAAAAPAMRPMDPACKAARKEPARFVTDLNALQQPRDILALRAICAKPDLVKSCGR